MSLTLEKKKRKRAAKKKCVAKSKSARLRCFFFVICFVKFHLVICYTFEIMPALQRRLVAATFVSVLLVLSEFAAHPGNTSPVLRIVLLLSGACFCVMTLFAKVRGANFLR